MEFWGVELKGDAPVKVVPGMSQVVHLSQATLAELKKKNTPVMLYAKVGDQKLVIGVLKADNVPQLAFDLVFEKEFELSHDWKDGCVHLTGYKSLIPDDDDEGYSDFSDDEEPLTLAEQNGVVAAPAASKAKPAALAAKNDKKPTEGSDDESDEDDDVDSDESGEDDESDEDMDDVDSSEEEETPVKPAGDKKRPASALKTPEAKKAKAVTPQKTDGKKSSGHVATPHPAKNAKTPKSGGQTTTCGSCSKTFNSQGALDSHTKAKHSAAK